MYVDVVTADNMHETARLPQFFVIALIGREDNADLEGAKLMTITGQIGLPIAACI